MAFAALVVAIAGFAGFKLDKRARAQLAPVYVGRTADARSALDPPLGTRVGELVHPRSAADATRLIALTFDDGPYPVTTPLLLDRLRDLGVHATFFVIGNDAVVYPDLTRRIVADGNELGNHTYTHPNLDKLGDAAVESELVRAREALGTVLGGAASRMPSIGTMMRPPHGRYTLQTVLAVQHAGYDVALWTDDPGDWRSVTDETLAAHVIAHATAPEVLLLHSGKMPTIALLDRIVPRFRAAGFQFVTLGELLRRVGPAAVNRPAHTTLDPAGPGGTSSAR